MCIISDCLHAIREHSKQLILKQSSYVQYLVLKLHEHFFWPTLLTVGWDGGGVGCGD